MSSDKTTLSQRAQEWWPAQIRRLDLSTVLTHESQWASYIEEQLGFYSIRRLAHNPHLVAEWRDASLDAGAGAPTVARTMAVSPPDPSPVFPGGSTEGFWTPDQYRYVRRKLWARAVTRVAGAGAARAQVARQTPLRRPAQLHQPDAPLRRAWGHHDGPRHPR